ncbi:MAG: Arc family DNA-binding protein [Burkholderiales bacterium]|nr:Arc family DNA-binding protein [Burkholderiales bacterium]
MPRELIRDLPPIAIRPSKVLRDRLEKAAKANGRSLNQELLRRLEHSLDGGAPEESASQALREAIADSRDVVEQSRPGSVKPDLLAAVMTGASRWMEKQKVKVEPERFAEFVALLYGYYEGRESIDETEFDRFMKLLA